jgi:hypothetical protein
MTEGLKEASAEVQQGLAREMTWFLPADAKNMDTVSLIVGFAGVLVSAYLAGFQEEALKTARQTGRKSFRWLKNLTSSYLHGDQEHPGKRKPSARGQEVRQLAEQAPTTAAALDRESYQRVLTETEKALYRELIASADIPKKRAEQLAGKIRRAVEKHVLSKGRERT